MTLRRISIFPIFLLASCGLLFNSVSQAGDRNAREGRDPAFFIRWSAPVTLPSPVGADSVRMEYNPDTTIVDGGRLAIVCGALAITVGGLHIYQENAWWKGQRGSFHVVPDPEY